ncbi:unnamed protein product [Adineta steineri]|uniref:Protein transport protein Sec24C n=1 Tax=Adineta steineri TaxID=433720 RepID=A0A813VK29_9BILA|nr:unnamed protein product [Adineta steineri]
MLAGPPPTYNTGSIPPTMHQPPSQMHGNQYQPPILPPNFQPNQQQFPPQTSMMNNGMSQPSVQHPYLNQGPSPSTQPDISTPPIMNSQFQGTQPPLHNHPPSNMNGAPSYKQNQYPNGPPSVPHPYPNSGLPSSNNFGPPTTGTNPHLQGSQPPPHNPLPSNMNGAPSYTPSPYPNGPPSSFPSGVHPPPYYPNMPGPPSMPGSQPNGISSYPGQPPSMPGSQPNGISSYPGQPPSSGPGQQSFPQSRIDADMVPNVIQVVEQCQEKIQEPFITNAPGLLPPIVGTNFICQDQGSCNPRFMRSTTYAMPNAADMVKQSNIPIALSISPLAKLRQDELEPPMSNFGEIGPVRCHRCKAYMCSFMQFIDGGKRFICCFCEAATDVPQEYFNHLDHSGRRMDWYQRPELCLGSYEIVATKQYCKDEKWPEPPAFIFMIDVSYNSVRSGLVNYICHILKTDLLDYLPKDKNGETSTVRIGFATFDKQIQFYNIKTSLGQPQMMVVSDLEEIFVPLLEGFLCSPQDSRGVINSLLDQIPQTFANSQETETILAPVIQAGIQALKGANCSGKIYVFSTTMPIAMAPGKLSNREDKKALGTEKEKTLLSPVNNIYTKLGEECAQNGCAVDLFVFPNNYYDLATIGEVCRISGGEIYKFNYFSIENDGERLLDELKRNFQRTTAFDALMRVRTSTGIGPIDFLGNFYMTNATEMIFGTIDSDKSVSVELKHEDKLPADGNTYTQVALLYTSISGQRRLRIITLALTVTSSYTTLYPACDLDTIMNYITKVAMRSVLMSTPKSIRDSIITQAANMLACYRKHCAQATTAGQLILPETLKLLPVYVASLLKSDALTGTLTLTTDDRSWLIHRLMSMNIKGTSAYIYPRIYPLHTLEENSIPSSMIRCLYERFADTGAYVIENGLVMYIWLGSQLDPTFVQYVFGLPSASHIQPEKCRAVELDNPLSKNVRTLLNMIRDERNSYMKLFVIQQRDPLESFFKNYLVEDKGFTGGASYVDFLYHLHREIRNILQ